MLRNRAAQAPDDWKPESRRGGGQPRKMIRLVLVLASNKRRTVQPASQPASQPTDQRVGEATGSGQATAKKYSLQ